MKLANVDTNKIWMSNKEAQAYLGVSKDWFEKRRESGLLHYSLVGKTIFYIKKEIDDIVCAGAVTGKSLFQKARQNK